jgi:hypothetical protein
VLFYFSKIESIPEMFLAYFLPNRYVCTFISGKVCLLTLIEAKRQTLPEINVYMLYRVGNKFSDTLNQLFLVNWFISNLFCENTKRKIVSSPHYLKILIKSTKDGLWKRGLRPYQWSLVLLVHQGTLQIRIWLIRQRMFNPTLETNKQTNI